MALARLQGRLLRTTAATGGNGTSPSSEAGRTPLLRLAREAGTHLTEAIQLSKAAVEVAAAVAAADAKTNRAAGGGGGGGAAGAGKGADDDGMRAREGWARAELSKLCLAEVAPEYVRLTSR